MRLERESTRSDADTADLRAQVELIEEENRRLRERYGRIRRTRHRRTAVGLAGIGIVALAGAVAFPDSRPVLVVLGAIGVFAGLLTWYLTPERFVAASVGELVYAALARNEAAVVGELGLADRRVYAPVSADPDRQAVLYVPQSDAEDGVDPSEFDGVFVVADDPESRGVAFQPTGEPLLDEIVAATTDGLADEPVTLVEQLTEGLRAQFELVDSVQPDVNPADGRASLAVSGSVYGAVDRFDHPIASLVATGLAVGLDRPVELAVDATPDGRGDYLVTVRWPSPSTDGAPEGVEDGASGI